MYNKSLKPWFTFYLYVFVNKLDNIYEMSLNSVDVMVTSWFSKSIKGDNLVQSPYKAGSPYSECCHCDGKQMCEVLWKEHQ